MRVTSLLVAQFRKIMSGGARFRLAEGVPAEWAAGLWREIPDKARLGITEHPLPAALGGGVAVIKVFPARDRHHLVRRLRHPRASREARGYRAFADRGIPTPELLMWGERRFLGLLRTGILVTRKIDVLSVARTFRRTGDPRLLLACGVELALIHQAGLTHGDSRARNFLATRPRPTTFDLGSWGRRSRGRRLRDLTRLVGASIRLSGGEAVGEGILQKYAAQGVVLPAAPGTVIGRAREWAALRADRAP